MSEVMLLGHAPTVNMCLVMSDWISQTAMFHEEISPREDVYRRKLADVELVLLMVFTPSENEKDRGVTVAALRFDANGEPSTKYPVTLSDVLYGPGGVET